MRFITGSNMPGYMPDETPSVSDGWTEAVAVVRADIERDADEADDPELDKAMGALFAELDAAEPGKPFTAMFNGRAYFVAEHDETYRTRWTLGTDPDGEGPDWRGPWSYADAKRDLAQLIEADHDSAVEAQMAEYGDADDANAQLADALSALAALTEPEDGERQTVTFMSRGFHLARVEEDQ